MGNPFSGVADIFTGAQVKKSAKGMYKKIGKEQRALTQAFGAYEDNVRQLEEDFDPFQVDQALDSLFSSVLVPLRRTFEEFQLPQMEKAFSSSPYGSGAQTGAAKWATAEAKRGMYDTEQKLRAGERVRAIGQNYADLGRKQTTEGNIFSGALNKSGRMNEMFSSERTSRNDYLSGVNMVNQGVADTGYNVIKAIAGVPMFSESPNNLNAGSQSGQGDSVKQMMNFLSMAGV